MLRRNERRNLVLKALYKVAPATNAELVKETGLQSRSISNALQHQRLTGLANIENNLWYLTEIGIQEAENIPTKRSLKDLRPRYAVSNTEKKEFSALEIGESIVALIHKLRIDNKRLREEAEDCERLRHDHKLMQERISDLSVENNNLKSGGTKLKL